MLSSGPESKGFYVLLAGTFIAWGEEGNTAIRAGAVAGRRELNWRCVLVKLRAYWRGSHSEKERQDGEKDT